MRTQEEWYSLPKINALLATDKQLRRAVGLDRVDSCDGARLFRQRRLEADEALSSEPAVSAASTPSTGVAVVEQAIFGAGAVSRAGVVRLKFPAVSDAWACTGNLLSGRVILIAAHCIAQSELHSDTDFDVWAWPWGRNDQGQAVLLLALIDNPGVRTTGCGGICERRRARLRWDRKAGDSAADCS